jgi:uncharacterized SAM-binding protein YcdF (DUF218 family)
MNLLVVLSHLMSRDCNLEVESIARADLAINKFYCNEFDTLVTLGWDYRADCTTPIADVVKNYILRNSFISRRSIVSITNSRDTVGDAFYCLDFFNDIKLTTIHVVTSDYHVDRTRIIFNNMFNNAVPVEVSGVSTAASFDPLIVQHEQQSLEAFYQTFKGVDFSSEKQIFTALSEKHPFYNGNIYPKVFYS